MTIQLNKYHVLGFVWVSGLICGIALMIGYHKAERNLSFNELMGCLPGTEIQLQVENAGERRNTINVVCTDKK